MKNLLITSAVLAMLAAPAMAVELGKGLAFDSTISTAYSVEVEEFSSSYEGELNYAITPDLTAYFNTTFDLQEMDSTGSILGIDYVPAKLNNLTVTVQAAYDADLEYTDTVISAELTF